MQGLRISARRESVLNFERSSSRPVSLSRALCVSFAAFVFSVAACTTSEGVDFDARPSGAAGSSGSGNGGNGAMTGAAGTNGGTAGATGTNGGTAGSNAGTAGSTSGQGGSAGKGAAGSIGSSGGTTGAAGEKVDAGAGGAGGPSDSGVLITDAGYRLTYTDYILPMLNNACGGCHYDGGTQAPKGSFAYTTYEKLTGAVTVIHTSCTSLDASKRRVVPGHPENSLIYIKVSVQNPPSGCGGHMPDMGTNMSAQNQADLKAWILSGAPR
ncbi:MAG: hypothetical protein JWM82_4118 [Myxococcales bacterium]|nr:hypothetical protein [Myxococcales bacterium]